MKRLKRKFDSCRIRDTSRWAIKITVCRINEQNVGWDEFGTYDVKGLKNFPHNITSFHKDILDKSRGNCNSRLGVRSVKADLLDVKWTVNLSCMRSRNSCALSWFLSAQTRGLAPQARLGFLLNTCNGGRILTRSWNAEWIHKSGRQNKRKYSVNKSA